MKEKTVRAALLFLVAMLLCQVFGLSRVSFLYATTTVEVNPEVAVAGAELYLRGTGFQPDELITATVQTPFGQVLGVIADEAASAVLVNSAAPNGTISADAAGTVALVLSTAANYQAGDWSVQLAGQQSQHLLSGGFTLSAPAYAAAPLTPGVTPAATPLTPPAAVTPAVEVPATPTTPAQPAAPAAVPSTPAPTPTPSQPTGTRPTTPAPAATATVTAPAKATTGATATVPGATATTRAATPVLTATPGATASPSATVAPSPTAPTPSTTPGYDVGAVVVTIAVAVLFAGPSQHSQVLASLPVGSTLTIQGARQTAEELRWYPVQFEHQAGYVLAAVLVLAPTTVATPGASPAGSASPTPTPENGLPAYAAPGAESGAGPAVPVVPPPVDGPAIAPAQLLDTFAKVSALTGVPQEVLLAIARVESNFTPNAIGPLIPQLAGTENEHALGMMQFLPSTYRGVMARVDAATGKNLGLAGIWDPVSAIYAAGFYLQDCGANSDIRKALYSYNNANWYVELILAWTDHYRGGAIPDPNLLDPGRVALPPLAAPQNPLLPSSSRHIDMQSPIQLYAPWTAGQTWYAGGDGSFYGDGFHADTLGNYYTVDFNKGTWPQSLDDDGEPILAAADGTVNNIYQDGAGAWVVELYHIAPGGAQLRTLYVHLKLDPRITPGIKLGQQVLHGTPIGLNGSTGNSTGAHLHFGLWLLRDGQWVSIRPEPMEGQSLQNGTSILSTNHPIATMSTTQTMNLGFAPAGPSNADLVTILTSAQAGAAPGTQIECFVNSAPDGTDHGQWLPVGTLTGQTGQIQWLTAPVAAGTYRLMLVQTDGLGNRLAQGLTNDTAVRYTIHRGEPRAVVVANPRTDLAGLISFNGSVLSPLGGHPPLLSGPLRFASSSGAVNTPKLGSGAVVAASDAPPSAMVRTASGLFVEEATTNLLPNPSFEQGFNGWTVRSLDGAKTTTMVTESALFGQHSLQIDNSSGTAPVVLSMNAGDGSVVTLSIYARALNPGAESRIALGMSGLGLQQYQLSDDWQRFAFSGATAAGGTERQVVVPVGVIAEFDGAQLEAKPYATSYADGSLGVGYGWDRATEGGIAGRLPTTVQISLAGLAADQRGAFAFWATPLETSADGARVFVLGDRLYLAVVGQQAQLHWGDEIVATAPWVIGQTHHYAFSWDHASFTFVVDGQRVAQGTLAGFAPTAATGFWLGNSASGTQASNALYQDLALWATPPTVAQLTTIASAGRLLNPGNDRTVTLDVALALATQGLVPAGITMAFSFDGQTWTTPEPFSPARMITLPAHAGEQRIYVRFSDQQGRILVVTDQIEVVLPGSTPATPDS